MRFAAFSERAGADGQDAADTLADYLRHNARRGHRIEGWRLAEDLDIDDDRMRALLRVATDSEIRLLEQVPQVRCPLCDVSSDERAFREAEETEGVAECPNCAQAVPNFEGLPVVEDVYTLTAEADAEARTCQDELAAREKRSAVMLCALPVELTAVVEHMKRYGKPVRTTSATGTARYTVELAGQDYDWTVTAISTGATITNAAAGAVSALGDLSPDLAIFVGVAGGIAEKGVARGDVVAADEVFDYTRGKDTDKGRIPRHDRMASSYSMTQLAQDLIIDKSWTETIVDADPNPATAPPEVHIEPIASGGDVVASTSGETYKNIRTNADRCVAVEMEGSGFLGAVRREAPGTDALVVRGISDLIDDKSGSDDEGWQEQAAAHAVAFAFALLLRTQTPTSVT